ncbi:GroES-like protein [Mycena rosella]|uniref:GroES-like protein n=1 Tax=Mycena rosella TaxID=1033263 RepID=A0AAD7DBL1_MYCRO|nr:GroES-like protein [Mycena rosella]
MSTQQALIIPSPKAPFILALHPIPSPSKGEVLLKVISVGLNPVNLIQHALDLMIAGYPAVLGLDIAGVVEDVGEDVQEFFKGDEVYVSSEWSTLEGGFQQYTTVPASILIRKPSNVSFDEAATLPVTFSTACVGLFAPSPIGLGLNPTFSWDKPHQGKSSLVIGGGTSTGQFAVQLLKFLGFTRIVAYASKVHFGRLRHLGATECIDRTEVPLDALAVAPPVKVVFDATFGAGALNAAYDAVVEGGSVVTVRPMAKCDREGRAVTLVHGYLARPEHTTFGKLLMKNLPELVERGLIVSNRVEVLPNGLAEIPAALDRIKAGGVSGVKLVAHPQDSAT